EESELIHILEKKYKEERISLEISPEKYNRPFGFRAQDHRKFTTNPMQSEPKVLWHDY
ncbi:4_t:CDS:2, partial [Funneliformis geosporum]